MVGDQVRADGIDYIVIWNGGPLLEDRASAQTATTSKQERITARKTWGRRAETGKARGPAHYTKRARD